jgi:TP901 family phage tail tape measure protein
MALTVEEVEAVLKLRDQMTPQLNTAKSALQSFGSSASSAGLALSAGLTAPIAAIGTLAVKAAVDYESAFTGVIKTAEGVVDELGKLTPLGEELRQGFLDLSREIPIAATELAAVGEAAGQLGIESQNILGFTRVMADLGATTNLSATEAATSLARFANITQMSQTDFDRLGSVIVSLGNNFATTEKEIVEMGLRLAAAGQTIGLTEAEILSVAAALSSLGLEAEAGGTSMSRVWFDMKAAVETGGEALENFASISDLTVDEFVDKFKNDAAGAVVAFTSGLGTIEARGGTVSAALESLGLDAVRVRDTLLRTASAGDLLTKALENGTQAWTENTALIREAELRYGTTESQMILLKNAVFVVAEDLGKALLPALLSVLSVIRDDLIPAIQAGVDWFKGLSTENRELAIKIAAVAAAIGPALVIFWQLAAGVSAVIGFVSSLAGAIGVGGLTTAAGGFATAFGIVTAVVAAGIAQFQLLKPVLDLVEGAALAVRRALVGPELPQVAKDAAAAKDAFFDLSDNAIKPAMSASDALALTMGSLSSELGGATKELANATTAAKLTAEQLEEIEAAAKAAEKVIQDLADSLSDAGLAGDVADLEKAYRRLTPAQQANELVIQRVATAVAALRARGGELSTELLVVQNRASSLTQLGLIPMSLQLSSMNGLFDLNKRSVNEYTLELVEAQFASQQLGGSFVGLASNVDLVRPSMRDLNGLIDTTFLAMRNLQGAVDTLIPAFQQLSQSSNSSIASVGRDFAALFTSISNTNLALTQLREGLAARNYAQITAGVVGAVAEFDQATSNASTTQNVIGGAVSGAQTGFTVGGPMGAAVGAIAGAIIGAWRSAARSAADNIRITSQRMWGIALPDSASQAVADLSDRVGNDFTAMLMSLGGIIQAGGGVVTIGFQNVARAARDIFSGIDLGHLNVDQALAALGPVLQMLKANLSSAGVEGRAAFIELIQLAQQFGLGMDAIVAIVGEDLAAEALGTAVPDAARKAEAAIAAAAAAAESAIGALRDAVANASDPAALQPLMQQLLDLGAITQADIDMFNAMMGVAQVDFVAMEAAAKKYGIELSALGPQFDQAKISAAANQLMSDFDLLTQSGADVGGVLFGMKDEIQALVQQAMAAGTQLPATMQPLIAELIRTGQLFDANGVAITDMSQIDFAAPIAATIDDVLAKLDEMLSKFLGAEFNITGAMGNVESSLVLVGDAAVSAGAELESALIAAETATQDVGKGSTAASDAARTAFRQMEGSIQDVTRDTGTAEQAVGDFGTQGVRSAQDVERGFFKTSDAVIDFDSMILSIDWAVFETRGVSAAQAIEDAILNAAAAVHTLNVGNSPTGLMHIPMFLEEGSERARDFEREASSNLRETRRETERLGEAISNVWRGAERGESINDFARRLAERGGSREAFESLSRSFRERGAESFITSFREGERQHRRESSGREGGEERRVRELGRESLSRRFEAENDRRFRESAETRRSEDSASVLSELQGIRTDLANLPIILSRAVRDAVQERSR